jgi:hypothetical protein
LLLEVERLRLQLLRKWRQSLQLPQLRALLLLLEVVGQRLLERQAELAQRSSCSFSWPEHLFVC